MDSTERFDDPHGFDSFPMEALADALGTGGDGKLPTLDSFSLVLASVITRSSEEAGTWSCHGYTLKLGASCPTCGTVQYARCISRWMTPCNANEYIGVMVLI